MTWPRIETPTHIGTLGCARPPGTFKKGDISREEVLRKADDRLEA